MSSLTVTGLSKIFGGVAALQDIDLAVTSGEFLVVIGGSGSGKSTLLRLLAGLETPTSGRIAIDGRDVTDLAPARRGIGMVFQSYALYPHLSVAENIAFPLRVAKVPKVEREAQVGRVAEMLDLDPLLARRPRALSGGERQRVAIGRAIIRNPQVLLLDEPLSNLDAALRVRLRHMFARLHQELGTTMIYVTHDQAEGMTLANRIVVMNRGRIEQVGPPLDLYARPATLTVAKAIGSPAINLMEVTIDAQSAEGTCVRLANGATLLLDLHVPTAAVGKGATLGIRPEHLIADPQGAFAGPIELFERLGPLSFVHLATELDGARMIAQLPGDASATLGETLTFSGAHGRWHLFAADESSLAVSP